MKEELIESGCIVIGIIFLCRLLYSAWGNPKIFLISLGSLYAIIFGVIIYQWFCNKGEE